LFMIEDFLPVNGSDFDCGNRANSLTGAATNAFAGVYLRKLPLRFGDCRTGTFHNAQSALNTGIFIDGSQPDLRFLFFGERYASDCAGRADFRAFIAIVIAKTFLVFYMHSGKFIISFFYDFHWAVCYAEIAVQAFFGESVCGNRSGRDDYVFNFAGYAFA